MLNLYKVGVKVDSVEEELSDSEKASVAYHNLFDFPLSFPELLRWKVGRDFVDIGRNRSVFSINGHYFLEGKSGVVYKRLLRNRISAKKILIAKKYSKIIGLIPTVRMIALTGSLAMDNSSEDADIDLMVVTKKNTLWSTRLVFYLTTMLLGAKTRKPNDSDQKDKLCLNMWLDESDLSWSKNDQNIYTAHEISQIVPLVNKSKTYEKMLLANKWILKYWPNAVKIIKLKDEALAKQNSSFLSSVHTPIENICFWIQKRYMKNKISREVVTKTRALFHPQDWGKVVIKRLTT